MATKAITDGYNYGPPVLVVVPGGAPLNATGDIEAGDPANGGSPVVVSPPAVVQKPAGGADLVFQPRYLNSTVGTVTTPGIVLPDECCFVFKMRTSGANYQTVAAQWVAGQYSWGIFVHGDGRFEVDVGPDGSTASHVFNSSGQLHSPDFDIFAVMLRPRATSCRFGRYVNGVWELTSWDTRAAGVVHNATSPITIGATAGPARLYDVELHTGIDPTSGPMVWRFDASEYPGSGTSYLDPRGRTWTLSNANAIVTE